MEILDAIREVFQGSGLGENLEIVDGPPDGDLELVSINNAAELLPTPLALRCLRQQVIILAKEHAAKFCGPVQKTGISNSVVRSSCAVRTSTPRNKRPRVMAAGTCTSM